MQNIFQDATADLFKFMKSAKDLKSNWINSIALSNNHFLLPICEATLQDAQVIHTLTTWRNEFKSVYPTQFTATFESTQKWLSSVIIPSKTRILFLIVDGSSSVVGHVGLSANTCSTENIIEIDNILKSPQCHSAGLMTIAIEQMIEWVMPILPVDKIQLKVMSDNKHAIDFYTRIGFIVKDELQLLKQQDGDFVNFVVDPNGEDGSMLVMELDSGLPDENEFILTAGPSISQMEGYFAYDAAMNGWNANWSKYITKFEQEFARYVGSKFALTTSSCTGALQISLLALEIGPGDEVIVPDETWVASATAVRDVGATPIFCDVDLSTYNMDVRDCSTKITKRTKAIMPVHMYGNPANIEEIKKLADANDLFLVEDAAPAIGAKFNGQCVGTFGDFGCYSFQGAKMLVTGEGGMLVTNNEGLYNKAKKIADQGRNPNKTFWIDEQGVKFKMSNVQAAIGLAQLYRSDLQIAMKKRINSWYKEFLGDIECIEFQSEHVGGNSINWMTSIRILESCKLTRNDLMYSLRENNVDSRPLFPAISQYPIWNRKQQSGKNAYLLGQSAMNLPSGIALRKSQVKLISNKLRSIIGV